MSALLPGKSLALIIVGGGESSRMGRDKTALPWGGGTVLMHQIEKAAKVGAEHIIISTHRELSSEELEFSRRYKVKVLYDAVREGPLGAFLQVYQAVQADYYWFMAADMPCFQWDRSIQMSHVRAWASTDSLIYVPTVDGQKQPFGSIYKREGLALGLAAANPKHSLMHVINSAPHTCEEINSFQHSHYDNMNYPRDYARLHGRYMNHTRKVPLITISASRSKTGKTSVVTKLITTWEERGKRVGFVKSDGHGFTMDKSDSDTGKATLAGAKAVAIVGPNGTALIQHEPTKDKGKALLDLSQLMDVDVVIVESRSQSIEPIIVVERPNYTRERIHDDIKVARYMTPDEDIELLADWIEETLM